MTSKARILVTGAAGNTGVAVARQLLKQGHPRERSRAAAGSQS